MTEQKKYPTPRGAAANKAKAKYNAKAYDQMMVNVPKGQRAVIDEAARKLGYRSRNEFIMAAINEKMSASQPALKSSHN